MQYLGGKHNSGKHIAEILKQWRAPNSLFVDVFCGALNIVRHVEGPRIAIDACQPLITTLRATLDGWIPPDVSELDYQRIKDNPNPLDPLTGFAMFGCSFGGKWGGGYARGNDNGKRKNYIQFARNSLIRKAQDCKGLELFCIDYRNIPDPDPGSILYCDPPYQYTTGYSAIGAFSNSEFWAHATYWASKGALVFVSEGEKCLPPIDWKLYHEFDIKLRLGLDRTGIQRKERIYIHETSPMACK